MKLEDYSKYYIQGSEHYLVPKDIFVELFNEMINWKQENEKLKKQLEDTIEELELVRCDLHNRTSERNGAEKQNDLYKSQQQEFINWLENGINKTSKEIKHYDIWHEVGDINFLILKKQLYKDILQKYKEIVVDDKNYK